MLKYGFTENVDFTGCKVFNTLAKQEIIDHALKLNMAKNLKKIKILKPI
jgi:anti-repressor protein